MAEAAAQLTQETLDWLRAGDARAFPALSAFVRLEGRKLGAAAEGEDLAQTLLLQLYRQSERGGPPVATVSELARYLKSSLRNRKISAWRKRQLRQAAGNVDVESVGHADTPEVPARGLEHVELCVDLLFHALERGGGGESMRGVAQRLLDRFVLGKDVEASLIEQGLLAANATFEQRRQARANENRRQSRARKLIDDGLCELKELTLSAPRECRFRAGAREVRFDAGDVDATFRFAGALARSERNDSPLEGEKS